MPVVRELYAPRFEIPDLVQRDLGAVLSCPLDKDGAVVAVTQSGSTFSLRKPDGSLLVSAAAVTVGVDGIPTYTLSAGAIAAEPFQMGYRAEWSLVVAGQTASFRNEVGIVRCVPPLPISDRNLTGRHSTLDRSLNGTGRSSWQAWIETTWLECQRWLIQKGNRPHLIVQSSDLVDLMRVWTFYNIFVDLMSAGNDPRYGELKRSYGDELEALKKTLSVSYAAADGAPPDAHRRPMQPVTFLGTSGWPDAGRGYGFDRDPWMP